MIVSYFPYFAIYGYKVKASNFYLLQKRSKLDGKIGIISISNFELEANK